MTWDTETEARLRMLWNGGMSASEIADKLGITKNMVISKAKRLMLRRETPSRKLKRIYRISHNG
jgi:hypothetical protein